MTSSRLHIRQCMTAVTITLAMIGTPAGAQQVELRSRVIHWLETTCGLQSESAQPSSVQALGQRAVPLFVDAFDAGPDVRTLEQIRDAAARRHGRIQSLLDNGMSFGLTQEDLAALQLTQRNDYVSQAVGDFVFAYEDAALRAVRVLDGTDSRQFLQRVADDDTSSHADTARRLLRGLGG